MQELFIRVLGHAAPQGSKVPVKGSGGRVWLREASKRVGPWRKLVTARAKEAAAEYGWEKVTGPVHVEIDFFLPRPKYLGKGPACWAPKKVGDGDKLTRAVWDALTDAGLWEDDSQVCSWNGTKLYTSDYRTPRAAITVREIKEETS